MRTHKTALNLVIISALVGIAALVLGMTGQGMHFQPGAGANFDVTSLWTSILVVCGVAFLFAWVRYDLSGGLALGLGLLHDLLIGYALTSLGSLLLGLSSYAPAFILAGAAFSFCLHVPVLREARAILHGATSRDVTRDVAASQAVKSTMKQKLFTMVLFLLLIIAFALFGNSRMWGALLPLLAGLLVACVSNRFLVPSLWAAITPKRKGKR